MLQATEPRASQPVMARPLLLKDTRERRTYVHVRGDGGSGKEHFGEGQLRCLAPEPTTHAAHAEVSPLFSSHGPIPLAYATLCYTTLTWGTAATACATARTARTPGSQVVRS